MALTIAQKAKTYIEKTYHLDVRVEGNSTISIGDRTIKLTGFVTPAKLDAIANEALHGAR